MSSQKLTKAELSNLLVEKHGNFIRDLKKEFDVLDRMAILKEKKEQLDFWVKDSQDNPEQLKKHLLAREIAQNEFSQLNEELKALHSSGRRMGPQESDVKSRHNWLKNQITVHEEALSYWGAKIRELSEAGKFREASKEHAGKESTGAENPKTVKKIKKIKKASKAVKPSAKKKE